MNSKGENNVPYGRVARPIVCDADLLRSCARWLGCAEVRSGSYMAAVTDAAEGDVVYLDPPYLPLSPTASFSKYAKDNFLEMDQWALAGVVRGLVARGVRVILSNSNTEMTRRIFGDDLDASEHHHIHRHDPRPRMHEAPAETTGAFVFDDHDLSCSPGGGENTRVCRESG